MLTRRSFLRASAGVFATGAVLCLGVPAVFAQSASLPDWLKLKADVLQNWTITPDPNDQNRFVINAKGTAPQVTPKRVLALFNKTSSAHYNALSTALDVFQSRNFPVTITAINYKNREEDGKADLAWADAQRFDLILAMGSDVVDFMYQNYVGRQIPVVTMVAKDPVLLGYMNDYDHGSGTNFAYTSVSMPVDIQMSYLKQVLPNLKNVAIMYEATNKSAIDAQVNPMKAIAGNYGITTFEVVVQEVKQARAELVQKMPLIARQMISSATNPQDSIFWITGSTSVFDSIDVIAQQAGKIPVLSSFPDVVKEGESSAVLSLGVSFDSSAYQGSIYAVNILSGKVKAGALKVGVVSPPDVAINFNRAQAIGMLIPFDLFESASFVYNTAGKLVRENGQAVE